MYAFDIETMKTFVFFLGFIMKTQNKFSTMNG